ncbi:hypothetical protein ACLB1E_32855 [Escherichia coli]
MLRGQTDAQALRKTAVGQTIQIGSGITKGLELALIQKLAAMRLMRIAMHCVPALEGADMVFIAAGMGGGTGTGCSTSRR